MSHEDRPGANPDHEDRLDSWKEIAAYLKRDVSTLHRWEKAEGLPIHRHGHRRRATAYAYRSEIDQWLRTRRAAPSVHRSSFWRPPRWSSGLLAGTAACALVVALLLVLWTGRSTNAPTVPRTILIATVENETNFSIPDGLIEDGLTREIAKSPILNVFAEERIRATLRLMRRAPETRPDPEIAREIAERDGQVQAIVAGRLEQFGTDYVLSFRVAAVPGGEIVGATSAEMRDGSDVVEATREAGPLLRETIERMPLLPGPSFQLEPVTTPSLEALRLYSRAIEASMEPERPGKWVAIESLLNEALIHDEEFASARILLAWAAKNQGRPLDEYVPHAKRAFDGSENLTDRERYFIRGSYFSMIGQDDRAIDEYFVLTSLHPDFFWGVNNLALALQRAGRTGEASRYFAARADLHPTDAVTTTRAALALAEAGDTDQAQKYQELARERTRLAAPLAQANYWRAEMTLARRLWDQGDYAGMLTELNRLDEQRAGLSDEEAGILGTFLSVEYLKLGQAEKALGMSTSPTVQSFVLPLGIGRPLPLGSTTAGAGLVADAIRLAREGRVTEAGFRLDRARESDALADTLAKEASMQLAVAEAEILRAQGLLEEARELLTEALEDWSRHSSGYSFFAAELLAELRDSGGDRPGAIEVLEQWGGSTERTEVGSGFHPVFWMRNRLKLAELIRDVDPSRADALESELRSMLTFADDDHYVVRTLAERRDLIDSSRQVQ